MYKQELAKEKNINLIIMTVLMIGACFLLMYLLNSWWFHKEAVYSEGHSEPRVYVTTYGDCYHKRSCSYIDDCWEIGLDTAKSMGYRKCSHCGGTPNGKIYYDSQLVEEEQDNYGLAFFIGMIILAYPTYKWYSFIDKDYRSRLEKYEKRMAEAQVVKSNTNIPKEIINTDNVDKQEDLSNPKDKEFDELYNLVNDGFDFVDVVVREEFSSSQISLDALLKFQPIMRIKVGDMVVLYDIITKTSRGYIVGEDYCDDERFVPLLEESTLAKSLLGKYVGEEICDKFIIIQVISK
ncbi:MAG: hypothetical protein IJX17_01000 [Clostridia bacterium]|nr:hypothetical protein [Clostridia bacterium]